MAKVKREFDDSDASYTDDYWLSYWANSDRALKEEGEQKPIIKCEQLDEKIEAFKNKSGLSQNIKIKDKSSIVSHQKQRQKERKTTRKGQSCDNVCTPSRKDSLKYATLSDKVLNLCEFQCPECKKKFLSRKSIRRHFMETDHFKIKRQQCLNTFLVKVVGYKCDFCSKTLLCEKGTILNHFKNSHNFKPNRKPENLALENKKYFKNVTA